MPTFGSATNPTFSGWIEHGAGWQFGAKFQTPAFDIVVTTMHGYFDTYQGNGAIGKMVIWQDGGGYPPILIMPGGVINNGTLTWGGQQWWVQNVPQPYPILKANSLVWLGMWCNQNIVVSTYDTNPQTFAMNSGSTSNPTAFNGAANSGQGPLGCYCDYSQVIYSGGMDLGSGPDGLVATAHTVKPGTQGILGNTGGGIAPTNSRNLGNLTSEMGGAGGLYIAGEVVNVPQIRIWR